jgi:hypothetical protein
MSILTIALDALEDPTNPDYAAGRADAYDAIHDGHPLNALEHRLDWLEDPRVSPFPAAYLAGYRAQIADHRASEHALRTAITHHDDFWNASAQQDRH